MGRKPAYNFIPGDWANLEYIISDVFNRIINDDTPLTGYLLADGKRPLTANWDAGSFKITASQLASDIATGTAPLIIASTTMVENLNADLLDGQHGSYYASAAGYVPYTGATGDVDLGEYDLAAANLILDEYNASIVANNNLLLQYNAGNNEESIFELRNGEIPVIYANVDGDVVLGASEGNKIYIASGGGNISFWLAGELVAAFLGGIDKRVEFYKDITAANLNISNWDTAYGWGDHASAGYLTAETDDLASVVARGANAGATINVGAGNTLTLASGSITDSTGAISFGNENLSTTGTVQGEQITSTDDITMAGILTNTMGATDVNGLYIDGYTNPYIWNGSLATPQTQFLRLVSGSGSTALPASVIGNKRLLEWAYDYSGSSTGVGGKSITVDQLYLSFTGDISVASVGSAPASSTFTGSWTYADVSSCTFSNSTSRNTTYQFVGGKFQSLLSPTINYTSTGTATIMAIGGLFTTSGSNPTVSAGTANLSYYGGYFEGIGTAAGTSTVYGGYFTGTGGDTNYDIFAANTGSLNVLAGNTRIGGTTAPTVALDITGDTQMAGDTWWTGAGTGLPYGEFHAENISETITVSATNTAYEVDVTGMTGGLVNLVTFTDHYLAVDKAGVYRVEWSISANTATAGDEIEGGVMVNGNAVATKGTSHTSVAASSSSDCVSASLLLTLAANDQVSLYVRNHTGTNNIVVQHMTCTLVMIGG